VLREGHRGVWGAGVEGTELFADARDYT